MIMHSLFACWGHREVQSEEKIYEPKEKKQTTGQLMQCSKDTPSCEFLLYSETLVLHISISWLAKKDQSFFLFQIKNDRTLQQTCNKDKCNKL